MKYFVASFLRKYKSCVINNGSGNPVGMSNVLYGLMLLILVAIIPTAAAQDARAADLKAALPPDDYILSQFTRADVVLLGEDHAVKQHLDFVASLIPKLYSAGINNLVMEFGAFEDQKTLDALLTAPIFDEALAKQLMFNYNSMWSWQEYRGLYRAAWAFNRTLTSGQKPFRILNMSYVYDWSAFDGVRTPQVLKRVFPRGAVDAFRASLIEREVLDRHEKALVLTGTLHAFTRFGMPQTLSDGDGFCLKTFNSLGNRLYRAHGMRITNLMFHQLLPGQPGATPYFDQPASGEVERLMQDNGNRPPRFRFARISYWGDARTRQLQPVRRRSHPC